MNLQTVNELTHLYVALNPCLADKKNGSFELKETNQTSRSKGADLDGFVIWGKNLLIKIGLASDFIKRSFKKQGDLNEQKNSAS